MQLRGRWRNTILVNVHASSEASKDRFYEELELVFLSFPKVPGENSIRKF